MPIQVEDRNTIIRPGYLVSLKTSLIGNISYHKQVLEREHIVADGSEQARWETKRVIGDRAEHTRGWKAQADARTAVTRICTNTAFGLLCPEERNAELQEAIAEAKQIATDFNNTARLSRINVYVIVGKIAAEQFDFVSAMAAEALELLATMHGGIQGRNASVIRTAANELRRLSDMFSENGRNHLMEAVEAGRGAARKIVKAPDGPAHEVEAAATQTVRSLQQQFQQLVLGGSLALQVAS